MSTLRGRLLVDGRLRPGELELAGERIAAVRLDEHAPADADALPVVAPGLVDLHVHGFGGADAVGDLATMAGALARAGTTSFQPTLFPDEPARLGATAERLWGEARALPATAARPLGLHLEGPFVNPLAAGALPRERLAEPSVEALRALLGPASGDGRGVTTMTVAPELSGAAELLAELERAGVRASLGHSRATFAEARAAAGDGRVGATHLFNAMTGIHHREVGLAGFALTGGVAWAEVIGDLAHVSGAALRLALAARGPRELALVSDALPGAGTGCSVFHWEHRDHAVHDGAAWFEGEEGEQLAGSVTGQLEAVRRLVARGVLSLEESLAMATEAPARALGREDELGRLAPGARADLLVLEGPELALAEVRVGGRAVPLAPPVQ